MWLWMVVFFSWSDLLTELSTWWLSYTMVRHNWKYFLSPDSDVQWNWANKKRKFTIKAIYTLHHFTLHSHPYVSWVIQWFFNHYPIFKIYWILKTLSFQPIKDIITIILSSYSIPDHVFVRRITWLNDILAEWRILWGGYLMSTLQWPSSSHSLTHHKQTPTSDQSHEGRMKGLNCFEGNLNLCIYMG